MLDEQSFSIPAKNYTLFSRLFSRVRRYISSTGLEGHFFGEKVQPFSESFERPLSCHHYLFVRQLSKLSLK